MPSFQSHPLAVLLRRTPKWTLRLETDQLTVAEGHRVVGIAYVDIVSLEATPGWVWSSFGIRVSAGETIRLYGMVRADAQSLRKALRAKISLAVQADIERLAGPAKHLHQHLDAFLAAPKYLANQDVQQWSSALSKLPQPDLVRLQSRLAHPLLDPAALAPEFERRIRLLMDMLGGPRRALAQRNEDFIKREIEAHAAFFDSIESRPLTDEQRTAAVVMEDRNLLIAAAGSGKSATVVAKIGYALRTGYCQPAEILAVIFNRNAREELTDRLVRRLPDQGHAVATRTFHKLGKDILAEVEGKQPTPAPWEDSPQTSAAFMEGLIEELLGDPAFLADWLLFRTVCFRPNRELAMFKDQQDYDRYLREVGQERDGHRGILTLNGELVRSMEEVAIANWLFIHGINYRYEVPYEYETADREHRQYHPDFYYPDLGLYHEHFALDDQGKPPPVFAGDYAAGVLWKRALHTEKGTALIETTSAMYRRGELFIYLETELARCGAKFRPRPASEVLAQLNQKQTQYAPFLRSFITHFKSNGLSIAKLRSQLSEQRDTWRATVFLMVFERVFQRYQEKLSSSGYIDYEDMVRRAADYVAQGKYRHPYQLILVDEFQDISQAGAALIRAMLAQRPGCKLFAVGDDWQSINRFAGADIEIMANFPRKFGVTATNYLTRTFRCNQGISSVAAGFVQANPLQYRKNVRSVDQKTDDVVQIEEYERDEDVDGLLTRQLEVLASGPAPSKPISVFILARYKHLRPAPLKGWQLRFAGRLAIEFRTVHRSKGLEADHVFLLGLNSGSYAFPSQIEDDPLLDLVMPAGEAYPVAEERRLFYVALTRARHQVTVLTKRSRMSRFIPELLAPTFRGMVRYGVAGHAPSKPCPTCRDGILREKYGKFGWFLGCSSYPACRHTETIRV